MTKRIVRRIVAVTPITFSSPLNLGGGEAQTADLAVERERDGTVVLAGTSIAGALRSHLARRIAGGGSTPTMRFEDQILQRLFGDPMDSSATSLPGDGHQQQSVLTVHEAVLEHVTIVRRDAVRIDQRRGTARGGSKYDLEVIEPGASGELCLEVTLREAHKSQEQELVELFQALLDALSGSDIRLGALTRRGFGRSTIGGWRVFDYDLQTEDGRDALGWALSLAPTNLLPPQSGVRDRIAVGRVLPALVRAVIEIELALESSLLVRSAVQESSPESAGWDVEQFRSDGQFVVPAKSWAGVVRNRVNAILRTVADESAADSAVARLFGPTNDVIGRGESLRASRISFEETPVVASAVQARPQTRVKIDRFTGGASPSALFGERAVWSVDRSQRAMTLRMTIDSPMPEEVMFILLVGKDLWSGDLPIGGETGIGRGVLAGRSMRLADGGNEFVWTASGDGAITTSGDMEAFAAYQDAWDRWRNGE